jgi:hypothetical protein
MTARTMRVGCALLLLGAVASADDTKKTDDAKKTTPTAATPKDGMGKMKAKNDAVFISAKDVKWGDAPPDLPKGAQLGVLQGDPSKAGPFTVRLKAPDGYKIPPHWHSQTENLSVLEGTLTLYMGDTMTSEAHDLDAGSYHYLPAKMHHAAQAKGDTIVQISGTGPFDIHYLNPSDNPNPKAATR